MIGHCRLPLLWAGMLLVATLCPSIQSKRGGGSRGTGVGLGARAPPSQSHGSSKQGLKLAGAAAVGVLGGAALGYGLGSLGRPQYGHGYGYGYGNNGDPSEGLGYQNRSDSRYYRGASSSGPLPSMTVVLGSVVPVVLGNWIRGI